MPQDLLKAVMTYIILVLSNDQNIMMIFYLIKNGAG